MEVTRELTLAFEGDVKKVILSNPVDNTIEYKKIEILPSTVKGKTCYQVCRYTKTQVFQKMFRKNSCLRLYRCISRKSMSSSIYLLTSRILVCA